MSTDNAVQSLTCWLVLSSAIVLSAQEQRSPKESATSVAVSSLTGTNIQVLAELPLSLPVVVCNGDEMTITASNSNLGSVLAEVRKCTGATIDMPEAASASRIFDHLGPGPARQVLTALLAETGYDFVIGSSDENPEKVAAVLLIVRAKDATETAIADRSLTPARRAYLQMLQNARPRSASAGDSVAEVESGAGASTTEPPVVAPADGPGTNAGQSAAGDVPSLATPAGTPPSTPNTSSSASDLNAGSPQSGSTADQITNMQQMFEQRRKMMQNQNPPPPQ